MRASCNFGANNQSEQQQIQGWVSLVTSEGHEAGAGGAVVRTMLVWRAAMREWSAWSRRMQPSVEAQSSARYRKSKRVRVRSIACTQCAQIGETENVPQQETVNGT